MMFRLSLVASLVGCTPSDPCLAETTPLATGSASPNGVDVSDVVERVAGFHSGTLSGPSGEPTEVELGLTWAGGADWTERTPNVDHEEGGRVAETASEAVCQDALVLPFDLEVSTADGRFALQWPVEIETTTSTSSSILHFADPRDLDGTWERPDASYDRVEIVFEATIVEEVIAGSIVLRGVPVRGGSMETWTLAVFSAQ